jgi:hypothetical protein
MVAEHAITWGSDPQVLPLGMEGVQGVMEHVGVGEDDVGEVLADLSSPVLARVPVVYGPGVRDARRLGQVIECLQLVLLKAL